MAKLAQQVYATALFELGKEQGTLEKIEEDMTAILGILEDNKDFFGFLQSPVIKKNEKKQVLETLFKGQIEKTTFDFLQVIVDKNRMSSIKSICRMFLKDCKEEHQILDVVVETAVALNQEQQNQLAQVLEEKSGKKIQLTQQVNPQVLGGLRVHVGNRIMDATLQSRLEQIKRRIHQTIV